MNEVLRNNENKILNPHIPRYEKLVAEYTCDGTEKYVIFDNLDLKKDGIYDLYFCGNNSSNAATMMLVIFNDIKSYSHYGSNRIHAINNSINSEVGTGERNKMIGRCSNFITDIEMSFSLQPTLGKICWNSRSMDTTDTIIQNFIAGYCNISNQTIKDNLNKLEFFLEGGQNFAKGSIFKIYKK